jgi:hypothetical protein
MTRTADLLDQLKGGARFEFHAATRVHQARGHGIISGGSSTGGVCNSGTWLRGYKPFQDLSATATCSQVASYVSSVIKAANASGSSMNAMLKAQMLATALDVYFSWARETVSGMLTDASNASNSGGSTWYGQVKATQVLAKDAFDAINNQVAFSL